MAWSIPTSAWATWSALSLLGRRARVIREWRSWAMRIACPGVEKSMASASQWPACLLAGGDIGGAVVDRGTISIPRPAALGAPSALILGAGEVEAPAPVVGTAQLAIDEAIDGLVADRSDEHTSEIQSLMRISYAVFCL